MNIFVGSMSDATTEVKPPAAPESARRRHVSEDRASFTERYSEVLGKVNETLDQVDWNQVGRIGKIVGIFAAVIVAQILIKGILDTINLLPVVPGLLELLGVVVVGQWSWKNLTTSDKRTALVKKVQVFARNTWVDPCTRADDAFLQHPKPGQSFQAGPALLASITPSQTDWRG